MNIDYVLHMVDEFALAMRDDAKDPNAITPAVLNEKRARVHRAIKALARGDLDAEVQATEQADSALATAARRPAPVSDRLTTDPSDPRLTRGNDDKPVPQAEVYLVLSEEERGKGFVRPYRDAYIHDAGDAPCGTVTTMGRALSETYARDPKFYGGTYCVRCQMHRPVGEFHWYEMDGRVGPVVGD